MLSLCPSKALNIQSGRRVQRKEQPAGEWSGKVDGRYRVRIGSTGYWEIARLVPIKEEDGGGG